MEALDPPPAEAASVSGQAMEEVVVAGRLGTPAPAPIGTSLAVLSFAAAAAAAAWAEPLSARQAKIWPTVPANSGGKSQAERLRFASLVAAIWAELLL